MDFKIGSFTLCKFNLILNMRRRVHAVFVMANPSGACLPCCFMIAGVLCSCALSGPVVLCLVLCWVGGLGACLGDFCFGLSFVGACLPSLWFALPPLAFCLPCLGSFLAGCRCSWCFGLVALAWGLVGSMMLACCPACPPLGVFCPFPYVLVAGVHECQFQLPVLFGFGFGLHVKVCL